jgi:hypothetical protein
MHFREEEADCLVNAMSLVFAKKQKLYCVAGQQAVRSLQLKSAIPMCWQWGKFSGM